MARSLVLADFDAVSHLRMFSSLLMILFGLQLIKLIVGGFRYFPESIFDLFALILSIGMISTLLTKQLFDLDRTDGMLPSNQFWYLTILGFLGLLLFSYLIDVNSRAKDSSKIFSLLFVGAFELFAIFQYIISGDLPVITYVLMLVIAPISLSLVKETSNFYLRLLSFVNAITLVVIAALNLEASLNVVFIFSMSLFTLVLFVTKFFSTEIFRNFLSELMSSVRREGNLFEFLDLLPVVGVVLGLVGFWVGLVVKAIVDQVDLELLDLGLNSVSNSVESTSSVYNAIIGGTFEYFNNSFIANIYETYGFLGLSLLIVFVVSIYYFVVKEIFKSVKSEDGRYSYLDLGLVATFTFLSIFFLVLSSTASLVIFYFLIVGLLAAKYAHVEKKLIEIKMLSFSKFKNPKVLLALRAAQTLAVIMLVVGVGYYLFNVDEVLAEL